jgi:hypothetical protein
MHLSEKALMKLVNDLAFELQDNRNEDTPHPYADGLWAGIHHLLYAQAGTANSMDGVNINPHKVKRLIESETKVAFADLFPHDYYPEDDD